MKNENPDLVSMKKEINKLARVDSSKLIVKLLNLVYPFPSNFDIDKIGGVDHFYRLRVGRVRAIFEVDFSRKEIWVRKVGYRGSVYKF